MRTPIDRLIEQLDNVPYTSNQQQLCFEASNMIEALRKEVNRWKNTAGIMHEALHEGDFDSAKSYYEEQCAPWHQ
jgi:hypothetical protein